jgi:hypothetical protein
VRRSANDARIPPTHLRRGVARSLLRTREHVMFDFRL